MIKNKNIKKAKNKVKRIIDPQKAIQRKQPLGIRAIYQRIGFERINSDGVEFKFGDRTGEIDDIFLLDNILIIAEYTVGKSSTSHLASKSLLYEKILANSSLWIDEYRSLNTNFKDQIDQSNFESNEFQIFICYASLQGVSEELRKQFPKYRFLDGTQARYFDALSKTIHQSAKHEFFNYLGVDIKRLGKRVHDSSEETKDFHGYLLPEGNSGYPNGFKVVSFYADPATLLEMSYVLRKDGWRDDDGLYQRILIKGKINSMRRYLTETKRVFVNNIVVTLPSSALIKDRETRLDIDNTKLTKVEPVRLSIPLEANMIGLIDGQHRVFCYHESSKDALDNEIAKQRTRQNLLVTGLVYPETWDHSKRAAFEAKLFLEINDTQARAKTVLKQSIEVLLKPYSTTAIAKEVINRLARTGPLNNLLQTNFFDPPDRIKTSSIVTYALQPLVKTDGIDSMFAAWNEPKKASLVDRNADEMVRKELLARYVEFCTSEINRFLIEAKMAIGPDRWKPNTPKDRQLLSTTTISGFFVCIRRLIESNSSRDAAAYRKRMAPLATLTFSNYKSSAWKSLGDEIFMKCFHEFVEFPKVPEAQQVGV
jgi:DGQHR domain-containing protein